MQYPTVNELKKWIDELIYVTREGMGDIPDENLWEMANGARESALNEKDNSQAFFAIALMSIFLERLKSHPEMERDRIEHYDFLVQEFINLTRGFSIEDLDEMSSAVQSESYKKEADDDSHADHIRRSATVLGFLTMTHYRLLEEEISR